MVSFGILIETGTGLFTLDPQEKKKTPLQWEAAIKKQTSLLVLILFGVWVCECTYACVCVRVYVGRSAHTWQLKNLMRLLLHTSSFSLYSNGDSAH